VPGSGPREVWWPGTNASWGAYPASPSATHKPTQRLCAGNVSVTVGFCSEQPAVPHGGNCDTDRRTAVHDILHRHACPLDAPVLRDDGRSIPAPGPATVSEDRGSKDADLNPPSPGAHMVTDPGDPARFRTAYAQMRRPENIWGRSEISTMFRPGSNPSDAC
jgi:hypothetical protein